MLGRSWSVRDRFKIALVGDPQLAVCKMMLRSHNAWYFMHIHNLQLISQFKLWDKRGETMNVLYHVV